MTDVIVLEGLPLAGKSAVARALVERGLVEVALDGPRESGGDMQESLLGACARVRALHRRIGTLSVASVVIDGGFGTFALQMALRHDLPMAHARILEQLFLADVAWRRVWLRASADVRKQRQGEAWDAQQARRDDVLFEGCVHMFGGAVVDASGDLEQTVQAVAKQLGRQA